MLGDLEDKAGGAALDFQSVQDVWELYKSFECYVVGLQQFMWNFPLIYFHFEVAISKRVAPTLVT